MVVYAVIIIFQRLGKEGYEFKKKGRKKRKKEGKVRRKEENEFQKKWHIKEISSKCLKEKNEEKKFQKDATLVTKQPYTRWESLGEYRRKMKRRNEGRKKERRDMRKRK